MKTKLTRIFGTTDGKSFYVALCLANFMGSHTIALSIKNRMTWNEAKQFMIEWSIIENCYTEENYPAWNR